MTVEELRNILERGNNKSEVLIAMPDMQFGTCMGIEDIYARRSDGAVIIMTDGMVSRSRNRRKR